MTELNLAADNLFVYRKSKMSKYVRRGLLGFCGALIGFVNGLFGAGGGMLVVPVLTYVAALTEKRAHATAIMIILPLCAASAVVYFLRGGYDYAIFAPTVSGVILGSVLGAFALKKANNAALKFVFYGLMLFAGLKMLIGN